MACHPKSKSGWQRTGSSGLPPHADPQVRPNQAQSGPIRPRPLHRCPASPLSWLSPSSTASAIAAALESARPAAYAAAQAPPRPAPGVWISDSCAPWVLRPKRSLSSGINEVASVRGFPGASAGGAIQFSCTGANGHSRTPSSLTVAWGTPSATCTFCTFCTFVSYGTVSANHTYPGVVRRRRS
jgi:hypothetical protein